MTEKINIELKSINVQFDPISPLFEAEWPILMDMVQGYYDAVEKIETKDTD